VKREKIDFADTETALVTVRAMAATLDEVVSSGDRAATKTMYVILADAMAGVTRLIHKLGTGLPRPSLSATFPPDSWRDISPEAILRDLANLVAIEDLAIAIKQAKLPYSRSAEAKRLSQEINRSIRKLKAKVISAKAWIQKHWPDAWTEKEESDYRGWL
jgi:hypothetical protein